MFKKLLSLILLVPVFCFGQAQRSNVASINLPSTSNYLQLVPNASVFVCTFNTNLTCNLGNLQQIFSDIAMQNPVTQPLIADNTGFYSYYVPPGTQVVEKVCTALNQCQSRAITISVPQSATAGVGYVGPTAGFIPRVSSTVPPGQVSNSSISDSAGAVSTTEPFSAASVTTGAVTATTGAFSGNVGAPTVTSPQVNKNLYASQYASVAAANAAASGCATCVMKLDSGSTLALIANTTLTGQWDLSSGGTITRGAFTLAFANVPIIGSDFDIFDPSGTGTVTFPSGTGRVNASWFGASPLVSDNTNALNQAGISAAASKLPLEISGGSSVLPVTGQITWNGVNTIRGNGPQGTSITNISTSFTAGCAIQIQNAFDAYVAGISLTYSASTVGITTASGICPETWRRGNMEHVLVSGAYSCLDTSQAAGQTNPTGLFQTHVDDFKCYNFSGHGMFLNKPVGSLANGTISSNLFTNIRFDNHNGPGLLPIDFINLTSAGDNHFDTINYQDTVFNGTGPAVFMGSDVDNTQMTNQHIEANTFACPSAGSVNCSFYAGRGSTTLMVDGITFHGNFLNIANIPGGKWALFQSETGGNFFRVQHVFASGNVLTGMVSTPVFNFFESGAAATGDATLRSYHILDNSLTVAGDGNFSASGFKDYLMPSQWPWWFYGVNLSAGDTDQTVDCNRPDHAQTIDYQAAFTGNHTLTLVTSTGYNGCQVQISMLSTTTVGSAFTLTVQDDAAHTIGVFTGSRSVRFIYTPHAVQWQIVDAGVLNDLYLSTVTFEGPNLTVVPQTSASLGVHVNSPSINLDAKYFDGSVSQTDAYTWRNIPIGTSNNPGTVLTLTTGGSAGGSSGGHSVSFGGIPISASVLQSIGTQTVSGCSLTSASGGSSAGKFNSGTAGTCTVTITPGLTAIHGYRCSATDLTTVADVIPQTTTSTTSCTISGTTASGDLITWEAIAF